MTTIILVHLGTSRVPYIVDCVRQIRLFNSCRVILAVDSDVDRYTAEFKEFQVDVLAVDPIEYSVFTNASKMVDGFWKKCSQRYFAVAQIAERLGLHHFFHMENDNMVYQDLSTIVDTCKSLYKGAIGATFDSPLRGIPGFMYFDDPGCARALCKSMMHNLDCNDMQTLRKFQVSDPTSIRALPIAPKGFCDDGEYSQNVEEFECVFDAAYFGQYVSGTDQGHPPGYISPDCVIDASVFKYSWRRNEKGLVQPFVNSILINNLHIHKKNLSAWSSSVPAVDVVVARYAEDLHSLFSQDCFKSPRINKIYVYNKSATSSLAHLSDLPNVVFEKIVITDLENVGRESHTYLYHILNHYADSHQPTVTVFLPGSCIDSSNKTAKTLAVLHSALNYSGVEDSLLSCHQKCDLLGTYGNFMLDHYCSSHHGNRSKEVESEFDGKLALCETRPFSAWFEKHFGSLTSIPQYIFSWGVFAVSRKQILSRSKEFYEELMPYVDKHMSPEAGHYFERVWGVLFARTGASSTADVDPSLRRHARRGSLL